MSTTSVSLPTFAEISRSWEEALNQFFNMMLDQEIKLISEVEMKRGTSDKPVVVGSSNTMRGPRVVSAVGVAGDIDGVAYYDLPEEMALAVTSKMLSLEPSECSHEYVNDALGELANMVTGAFKNQFVARGLECRLTVPSLIRGSSFSIEASTDVDCYHYCYKAGEHVLDLFLTLKLARGEV